VVVVVLMVVVVLLLMLWLDSVNVRGRVVKRAASSRKNKS